jgi:ribosomal protein S18 acetylase RimI-like enzyme
VSELAREAFGEYDPSAARTTTRMMLEAASKTLLAERGEERLGFAIVRAHGDALAVDAIAVLPAERGRGVGKLLMRAAEQQARARGLSRLTLNTAQANLAALDLFLRLGWVIVDRAATRYWRGQPACKLEKRLR